MTTEDRVSRLEGAYEHLATKADLEKVKSDLTWRLLVALFLQGALIVGLIQLLERA